jgi:hypothetical protein
MASSSPTSYFHSPSTHTLTLPSIHKQYYNNTIAKISLSFNQSVAIWLWNAAFVDVAISVSLLITLKQRYAGSNNSTDSILRKLILISLQTAAYTSFLAVAGGK